jgi:hypothetical protein
MRQSVRSERRVGSHQPKQLRDRAVRGLCAAIIRLASASIRPGAASAPSIPLAKCAVRGSGRRSGPRPATSTD